MFCAAFLYIYSVFCQLRYAKFAYSGSILSSRQFLLLPQQPLKMAIASIKEAKIDSKVIILLPQSKSVKLIVPFCIFWQEEIGEIHIWAEFTNKIVLRAKLHASGTCKKSHPTVSRTFALIFEHLIQAVNIAHFQKFIVL